MTLPLLNLFLFSFLLKQNKTKQNTISDYLLEYFCLVSLLETNSAQMSYCVTNFSRLEIVVGF